MFCPFCGAQVPETTSFCPECGRNLAIERVDSGTKTDAAASPTATDSSNHVSTPSNHAHAASAQPTPPQQAPIQTPEASQSGATPPASSPLRQEKIRIAEQNGQGMKWYKFLIYFSFFFGAFIGLVMGINFISGYIYLQYGTTPDVIYSAIPQVRPVDIMLGIVFLAQGVWSIYARILMTRFSKKAPMALYIRYIVPAVSTILYNVIVFSMLSNYLGNAFPTSTVVVSIVSCAISIWLNTIYFKKRAYLFTEE